MTTLAISHKRSQSTATRWTTATADDIIARAKQGDGPSWAAIHAEFAGSIGRFAASKGIRDCDDIVQEVFFAAARNIGQFEGDCGQFRSWLFTIAHRRCADHYRRGVTRTEQTFEVIPEEVDLTTSADVPFWHRGEVDRAVKALGILNEIERDIASLRVLAEMDTREVAQLLEMTPVNVRVTQSRAVARLRRHLRAQDLRQVGWLGPFLLRRRGIIGRLLEKLWRGPSYSGAGPIIGSPAVGVARLAAEAVAIVVVSSLTVATSGGTAAIAEPDPSVAPAVIEAVEENPGADARDVDASASPGVRPTVLPDSPEGIGGALESAPPPLASEPAAFPQNPLPEPADVVKPTTTAIEDTPTTLVDETIESVDQATQAIEPVVDATNQAIQQVSATSDDIVDAAIGSVTEAVTGVDSTVDAVSETAEDPIDGAAGSLLSPLLP